MPDLDLIKQAEQGCAMGAGGFCGSTLRGEQRRSNLGRPGLAGSRLLRFARNDTWEDRHSHRQGGDLWPVAPLYRFKGDAEAIRWPTIPNSGWQRHRPDRPDLAFTQRRV